MASDDFFEKTALFSFLPVHERSSIKKKFSRQNCKKDEFIFFEGEVCQALYILLEGKIKIIKQSSDGKEIILEFISPGELFGAFALISNSPFPASAVALGPVEILKLPKKTFCALWEKYPEVTALLTETLGKRLISAHNFKQAISHDTAEIRLATVILKLFKELQPNEVEIKVTRKELAELVGTTVETTIRTLG
ncbi:MAG: Crp/Fnr family transcriptional regulator, partial [Nitrospinota bacterium]